MQVLIADDHAIFRRGLREILIEGLPNVVVSETGSAQATLQAVWKQAWDLLIMDISMPDRSGLEILSDVKLARPELPVLILSMHPEEQFAVSALKAGAAGYITKMNAPTELVAAAAKVLQGGRYVSKELGEQLAGRLLAGADQPPHEALSDREFQVFRLLGSGRTVKEIASRLSVSVQTVSTHRLRLLKKMGMQTNAELMRYALERKLVD